jgi:hypothetical protein
MDCTALTVVEQPALPVEFEAELGLAGDFARASKAESTRAAYASDFRIFESWCPPTRIECIAGHAGDRGSLSG